MPRMPLRFQLEAERNLESTEGPVSMAPMSLPPLSLGQRPIRARRATPLVRSILMALAAAVVSATPAAAFAKPTKSQGGGGKDNSSMDGCVAGDTLSAGHQKIDQGNYEEAVRIFTCVMAATPTEVDAYVGRSEAELMLGRYSDAYHDLYANLISVMQPQDLEVFTDKILQDYNQRLNADPWDKAALTGASFAMWAFWDYADALPLLDQLLILEPNNVYAKVFRGSTRLFAGVDVEGGLADLEAALKLAPNNAHVHYIVADAYTYAHPDLERAFSEASFALEHGLDTPRVHAILATALNDQGDLEGAAEHIQSHIEQSTTKNIATAPLAVGQAMKLHLEPGQTYEIPIQVTAGQPVNITTESPSAQLWDSILVVLDPDGNPVIGSDDEHDYYAGLDGWIPEKSGTYKMRVTSFEGISSGPLDVTRNP